MLFLLEAKIHVTIGKKKIVELLKAVKKKLLKFGLCPAAGVVTACVDYFEKG